MPEMKDLADNIKKYRKVKEIDDQKIGDFVKKGAIKKIVEMYKEQGMKKEEIDGLIKKQFDLWKKTELKNLEKQ